MEIDLIFAAEVEADLGQAFAWYERRGTGLGDEFLRAVDVAIRGICRNPEIHGCVKGSVRRALVRRFPYAIHYERVPDSITIYCICHTAQDADKWQDRLP